MTPHDTGRIVAIDVETGAYVIDSDELKAAYQVLDAHPDAQIWLKRVGFDYVTRMPYMRRVGD